MIALCAKGSAGRAGKWALCAALAAAAGLARADLPVEELKGGTRLPPATPHRLYVMDAVFNHLVDSRINIYDGDTMKFLGLVPSSFNGHMTVSADGKDIYIMTTYYERLNRGKRTDVVEAWIENRQSLVGALISTFLAPWLVLGAVLPTSLEVRSD